MKKSGHRVPRVELSEMGPSLDLVMRRTALASHDLYKTACKQPKEAKVTTIIRSHFYYCFSGILMGVFGCFR